jgi:hypothetical protein
VKRYFGDQVWTAYTTRQSLVERIEARKLGKVSTVGSGGMGASRRIATSSIRKNRNFGNLEIKNLRPQNLQSAEL